MLHLLYEIDIDYFINWAEEKNNFQKYLDYYKNTRYIDFLSKKERHDSIVYGIEAAICIAKETRQADNIIYPLSNLDLRYLAINDKGSFQFANLFECLVEASDYNTQQAILPLNDDYHENVNEISIVCNGRIVGTIGQLSDLFYLIFDHLIKKTEYVETDYAAYEDIYTLNDVSNLMSIQIWDKDLLCNENLIENIIYFCSANLNLNFKRKYLIEKFVKFESKIINLDISKRIDETHVLVYYNNANVSVSPRFKFSSYYQVLEYYFTYAQNDYVAQNITAILEKYDEKEILVDKINGKMSEIKSELSCLKYLISKCYTLYDFHQNIYELNPYFSQNIDEYSINGIDVSSEDSFIRTLAQRIYKFRCAIIHSKNNEKDVKLIPNITDEIIFKEIELINNLALSVLKYWSKYS